MESMGKFKFILQTVSGHVSSLKVKTSQDQHSWAYTELATIPLMEGEVEGT